MSCVGQWKKIKQFNYRLENNEVMTLTFWGHMTSSVMWPFNSRWATSNGWSVVAMHLSCSVIEIWRRTHIRMMRWFY